LYAHAVTDLTLDPNKFKTLFKDDRIQFVHLYQGEACGHFYVLLLGNHKGYPVVTTHPFDLNKYNNNCYNHPNYPNCQDD
jgi:hypothetical protein